jgi:plastocyanin
MRRGLRVAFAGVLFAAAMVGGSGTAQAQPAEIVEVVGGITIDPGTSLTLDWRFEQANIQVPSGERVRWVNNADVAEPHTVTLVRQKNLPQNIEEAEACFGPRRPCGVALRRHGGAQNRVLAVEDDKDAEKGLDEPRDSRWLKAAIGSQFSARISAPAGTTLYYLCALHPWMQGTIDVT